MQCHEDARVGAARAAEPTWHHTHLRFGANRRFAAFVGEFVMTMSDFIKNSFFFVSLISGAIHEPTFRYRVTYSNKDGKNRFRLLAIHILMANDLFYIETMDDFCCSHGRGKVQEGG